MALYSVKPFSALLLILSFIFLVEAAVNATSAKRNSGLLCIESEKQALLSFKQDLVDHSNMLISWAADGDDCCSWRGIVCDNITGHVQQLLLGGNYDALSGKVNPFLLNLTHLTLLDLSYNDFSGTQIPSFIGSLTSLKSLKIVKSRFEGKIPHQLGNLSNLSDLILKGNNYLDLGQVNSKVGQVLYDDDLHWLSGLSSLEYLEIEANLSAVSNWLLSINELPSLLEISMSRCELSHINPISYVNFTTLEVLDVSLNNFQSSVPNWIFNLSRLSYLNLYMNNFEGPLPSVSNLRNIVDLILSRNAFDASIACIFQNSTFLKYVDFSGNNFHSTIPTCIYRFNTVETLSLGSNDLHGVISSAIENLTSVVHLDLSYNALEGKLPPSMGKLCNLQNIDLSENKFGGGLSEFLEALRGCNPNKITSMRLGSNMFSGQIKEDTFEKFESLSELYLSDNMLSGPIPTSLGKLLSLSRLEVRGNLFNGSLPESLGSLSSLDVLDISDNGLEGVVSEIHFANLTNLRILEASRNSLVLKVSPDWTPPFDLVILGLVSWSLGPQFPKWLISQKRLDTLDLSQTGITGVIPNWFWNSSNSYSYMNLSHNQISGGVPDIHNLDPSFLGSIIYLNSNKFEGSLPRISSSVKELDLSNNSFTGEISHFLCNQPIGEANKLQILHLGDNYLSGKIPDCWMYWPSLILLKLGDNNLTGKIPISMGSLVNLQSLHLRNNYLSGEIPTSLRNCRKLNVIDLGLNMIEGHIPTWIGDSLSNLMIIGLRSNKLSGHIPLKLCQLNQLQILDFARNKLSGIIPRCFGNFKGMVINPNLTRPITYSSSAGNFMENAYVFTKGREDQYNTILTLVTSLDLSNNDLSGEFPIQLTSLHALRFLNLSRNSLNGSIPNQVKEMAMLESFDVSMNQLSGVIPPGMSSLTFLNHLNLSYNNLSGEIPTSTQLQSMEASCFIGNQLCGLPLLKKCREDHEMTPNNDASTEDEEEKYWFRLGIAVGFGVGFVGIIGPLLVCGVWRRAYFWFFNEYMWYKIEDCFIKVRYMLKN